MGAPFKKIFPDETEASTSEIRALVGVCQERKQTGVIRLYIADEHLGYLFIKRGGVVNSQFVSPGVLETVAAKQWDTQINSIGKAYPRFVSLSTLGLQICKLLIQSASGKDETVTQAADIGAYLETQKKNMRPLLVQFEQETSEGVILFSGSPQVQHSIFISPDTLHDEAGIAPFISNPGSNHFELSAFDADPSVEAWQEYILRYTFANICEKILSKIQMLTSRSVVDSLNRLITAYASRNNLSIGIVSRKVMDDEFFASPRQAADTYRLLLNELFGRISKIAGPRMLTSIIRGINENLLDWERSVVTDFSLLSSGDTHEHRA